MQFEENRKNPKISSSCSFYKISDVSQTLEKKTSNENKKIANKTNYFAKDDDLMSKNKEIEPIDELPNTWKKVPPKINSSKLPSAFGNIFQKTVKNHKNLNEIQLNNNNNPIRNIENIVNMQEYKQATQLLSPLKLEGKPPKPTKNQSKFKKNKPKTNPLEPLKSYMASFEKISQEISDLPANISQILKKTQGSLMNSKLKLEEMITLSIKKTGRYENSVKKMLHVPSLLLYAIKEIPIKNPEIRKNLKDWISNWQNNFQENPRFVKVYGTFWNVPEGNLSIIMELMNAGSLQTLLDCIGSLQEQTIRKICKEILKAISLIHQTSRYYQGYLTTSQVLFDRDCNIKISLGSSRNLDTTSPSSTHKDEEGSSLFINNTISSGLQSNDIYNIGLICLISAIGSLDILGIEEEKLQDSLHNKGVCCIIHADMIGKGMIGIKELLDKRGFSKEFQSFLCLCLNGDQTKRPTAKKLLEDAFFKKKTDENVNLKELIKIGLFWDLKDPNNSGLKILDRLSEGLKMVLPNCEKWFTKEDYKPYIKHLLEDFSNKNEVFKALEGELGVCKETIYEKVKEIVSGFSFISI